MAPRLVHYSDVENAHDDPERIGRLAGTVEALDGPDAVVCGTGDDTGPGVLSLLTGGRQALPFFEAVGTDFETFGNHDFDHGLAATRDVVRESPQTWLNANVFVERAGAEENGAEGAEAGKHEAEDAAPTDGSVAEGPATGEGGAEGRFLPEDTVPWATATVDGRTLGFVGVVDPTTAEYNPATAGLAFADPIEAVARGERAVRGRGAEDVIVCSHLGGADDDLAAATEVDVILGGHVHSERCERVDGTLLTRPGVNGHVVYEVDLAGTPTATRHEVAVGPVDDDVAEAARERRTAADLDEEVARVDEPIERTHEAIYGGESRIGNVVSDAYRWAAGADVGLQNSGGIREGPALTGAVTVADLVSVVPFEEPVAVARLSGAELRELVHQCSREALSFGEDGWWNGHLAGCSVAYDQAEGRLESLDVGGEPVAADGSYAVATTAYLFHTDEEFPVLDDDREVERLDVQYEVLADYARECGIDPRVEGRIRTA